MTWPFNARLGAMIPAPPSLTAHFRLGDGRRVVRPVVALALTADGYSSQQPVHLVEGSGKMIIAEHVAGFAGASFGPALSPEVRAELTRLDAAALAREQQEAAERVARAAQDRCGTAGGAADLAELEDLARIEDLAAIAERAR
jgi:hypothetical protein